MNHATAPRRRSILAAFMLGGLLAAGSLQAAPPADLDAYAKRVLDTFQTPGMAIAIVERGQPAVVRTYGVRKMDTTDKVDERTLFPIGSTTKAFTGAVLATLVDEGKLTWESKVSDVLPGFKLYDPYATSEMTVRDLLVHRSGLGLGAGDLMVFPPTDLSSAEIVRRLRYIKPASSFRSTFAYNNLMYVVAGEVIQAVDGAPWDQAIRRRILDPLQMKATSTSSVLPANANRAWPHARITSDMRGDGPVVPLPAPSSLDNAAPAGALNTSISDIVHWLEVQLGRGFDPQTNKRIYSEAQAEVMWSPQTVVPVPKNPKPIELAQTPYRAYALGWRVDAYRGEHFLSHGGGVPGSVTLFVIVPGRDVAFAVVTNSEEAYGLAAIEYHLLDHYLGLQGPDWSAAFDEARQARIKGGRDVLASNAAAAAASTGAGEVKGPSLPIERYAGNYRDDWYGGATIERAATGLKIRFEHTPALSGPLEHVRYDTFIARWKDRTIEDAYVTFALDPSGKVERMTLRAVSPLADFSYDFQDLLFRPAK
jgi:CubicO group peptidase (beta-lactamase class C family)